ncbi:MAG: hypothetical protein NTU74_18020 [Deltaproteobacteria bacterium]|nr:hypothetical protein [Deltaproteobacteria bacterium]
MKLRSFVAAMLMFAAIPLVGCSKSDNEEASELEANVRQTIEKKARACLGEKNESEEIWSFSYDEERHMFTGASERICVSRHGNIIHNGCENVFLELGERQIFTDDDTEITKFIEYNIERMNIELDVDEYRHKDNRTFKKSSVVPYDKLRGPERYRMERVASCLNSANIALKIALKNKH